MPPIKTFGERIADALVATEFCRDWRNRHIAHRDLQLALKQGAEPLKPASRSKVREALEALKRLHELCGAQ